MSNEICFTDSLIFFIFTCRSAYDTVSQTLCICIDVDFRSYGILLDYFVDLLEV